VVVVVLILSRVLLAQTASTSEPFKITDNSFLVEEAFNQDKGVFQNIFGMTHISGTWAETFTQEWPVPGETHQLSYTLLFVDDHHRSGIGDTLINYRYQVMDEAPGQPAFAPRVSLIVPTGNSNRGLGDGSVGLQVNLPFSKQTGDWYWHWNAGLTWLERARATFTEGDRSIVRSTSTASPFFAGSAIYRLRPMLHLMLESLVSFDQTVQEEGTSRDTTFTLSPGIRGGWDIGEKQVVLGLAVPITWSGDTNTGVFVYASYELPFRK
jgi:hypothetical protein